jgi:hypothetical protein
LLNLCKRHIFLQPFRKRTRVKSIWVLFRDPSHFLQARVSVGFVLQNLYQRSAIAVTACSIAIISFRVLNEPIPSLNIIETKNNEKPLQFPAIEKMADKLEAIRVDNLWYYNVATSNTKDARRSLFSIIRDNDKLRLVYAEDSYKSQVESGIKFLQSRHRQAKEKLEEYLVSEEEAITVRNTQREKAAEEWGGSSDDILSQPNQVWIPGPDYYFLLDSFTL